MTVASDLGAITDRQREVWRWVRSHYARERIGCSVRGIGTAFGFASPEGVMCHLRPLRKRGWIEWKDGRPNTIIPTLESLEVCDD
jgi:SOS-response transcriptional repressor LexA